jgi:UDP-glucose 6-dehydrogenase
MESPHNSPHIAVFGLGYVGCVTAACFSTVGHRVTGVDKDSYKVEKVLAGEAPFFEPGLEAAVRAGVASGNLTATTSTEEAVRNADIALLCVGTRPSATAISDSTSSGASLKNRAAPARSRWQAFHRCRPQYRLPGHL